MREALTVEDQVLDLHVEAAAERLLHRALAAEYECFDTKEVDDAIRRLGMSPPAEDDP